MSRKSDEESSIGADDTDDTLFEGHVHKYFERTSPMFRGAEKTGPQGPELTLPPAANGNEISEKTS